MLHFTNLAAESMAGESAGTGIGKVVFNAHSSATSHWSSCELGDMTGNTVICTLSPGNFFSRKGTTDSCRKLMQWLHLG
eukprot:CAMPEP_0180538618 /NCGR_PEP_ID=MMETSP1036_2-20121128/66450_1 /TAXON_ID=632150 /ORGANISM="Azadinium spinosum, Strain 3D9" /LENGTH=78 /DNA_ID=CAMNT_0022553301 /DNA_START=77 /DNA_END=313 /DNA_ORIENTATION=+